MSLAGDAIRRAVQDLYERHPYPRYPLLARPRWQDGYLAHSGLARALARDTGHGEAVGTPARGGAERVRILVGGAGEILPYVIRKGEPRDHDVVNLDLSRQSLRRARLRLLGSWKRAEFVHGDLDRYLDETPPASFAHADAYGVVHHMADPGKTLVRLGRCLTPGGTLRLMVYNAGARQFIRHLQHAFALLGLSAVADADLRLARRLLVDVAAGAPTLAEQLRRMGDATITSDARLADTFLHPRETRLALTRWLDLLAKAELRPVGLLDRYGELDDLPNPLWEMPTATALETRVVDRRFENNLELFAVRTGGRRLPVDRVDCVDHDKGRARETWSLSTGPSLWYSFEETRHLPGATRQSLWRAHRAWTEHRVRTWTTEAWARLPDAALARLARLGAVLPGQLDQAARRVARAPLEASMEPPATLPAADRLDPRVAGLVASILHDRGLPPARAALVLARLAAARC